jgi:hypothetical protein
MSERLTKAEKEVMSKLADAFTLYTALPGTYRYGRASDDDAVFRYAIETGMNHILARPAKRKLAKEQK